MEIPKLPLECSADCVIWVIAAVKEAWERFVPLYITGWDSLLCWNVPTWISLFVVQVCFDHKPRIISKTNKDDPSFCSHPVTKHNFENHKWVLSHLSLIEPRPQEELEFDGYVFLSGAWFTFWRSPQSVTPRSGRWVQCISWTSAATRFATAASGRTTASTPTASSSWRSGCYSSSAVRTPAQKKNKTKKRIFRKRCDFLISFFSIVL